jgi:pilus assembly protein CpaB
MRRQTLIALGVAVFFGLLAVFLANTFLDATTSRNNQPTTQIAVAAVPLSYGMPLTPDRVKFVELPNSAIPAGSFTNAAELLPAGAQRVALRPIAMNEPILADKVTGKGQGASIAALLSEGKRAVSVRIDDVSGVAGFVQPNDTVDVLVTRTVPGSISNGQVTDVLLQNVRVLATDQQANNPEGKPSVAKTATLEVDPLDAQKLALAQQAGSLSLVLRKPGVQQDLAAIQTVSLNDLRYGYSRANGLQPVAQARAAAPVRRTSAQPRRPAQRAVGTAPKAAPGANVEVVRGTTRNNYTVGDYAGL